MKSAIDEMLELGVIREERGERRKRTFYASAPVDAYDWSCLRKKKF